MCNLSGTSGMELRAYIESARKLSIYGGESGWEDVQWSTTTLRRLYRITFCELRRPGSRHTSVMQSPFLEFAKAYVRHTQSRKECSTIDKIMPALRFLHAGLIKVHGKPDVLLIDGAVQESVRELVTGWYTSDSKTPCHIGRVLMSIYAELREKKIHVTLPIWQSPWKAPLSTSLSMSPKARAWREERTPNDEKIAATFVAFQLAETEKDQYWSSLAILLAFASSRGGELVDLHIDSLIDEIYIDKYGRSRRRVGLRWFSQKGFSGNVKWVPRLPTSNGDEAKETELMDMVVLAFNRLLRISEPARNAARMAFETEGTVYPIHKACVTPADYPQDRVLSDPETVHATGRTSLLNAKQTQIKPSFLSRKYWAWHFTCVEKGNPTYREIAKADYKHFAGRIHHWPFTSNSQRVKVWECLVLYQWAQFSDSPNNAVYPNSYCLPNPNLLGAQLSGRWSRGVQQQSSLFKRLGLTMEDGSPIQMFSHDFRRWHGTRGRALAHKGLTEHRLRMLAGRQDINQNDAYDYNTPEQKAGLFRQIIPISRKTVSLDKRLEVGDPIYRHELLNRDLGDHEVAQPIQIGEFGGCTHSLSEPPCMKGGDCLPCSEKRYIKGTPGCLEKLQEMSAYHKGEFDALDEHQKKWEQFGIDQWMTYHAIRYAIAECFVRQMKDPSIPDGSVLGLDERYDPSPLAVNLMEKGIEVPNNSPDPVAHEINLLLGLSDA